MTKKLFFDIETTSLNPFQGRIICISLKDPNSNIIESSTDEDETEILKWCMKLFSRVDEVIGFNIHDFDMDFLIKRCLVKRVPISLPKIVDLRLILGRGNKFSKGTMRLISSQMGFEANTLSGAEMERLYEEKKFDEIKRHCEEDVLMTEILYIRMKEVRLI